MPACQIKNCAIEFSRDHNSATATETLEGGKPGKKKSFETAVDDKGRRVGPSALVQAQQWAAKESRDGQ